MLLSFNSTLKNIFFIINVSYYAFKILYKELFLFYNKMVRVNKSYSMIERNFWNKQITLHKKVLILFNIFILI